MEIAIIFLAGMLVGYVLTFFASYKISTGNLRIDHSDPTEEPYLFLELSESVREVMKKKYVVFKVNTKNYIS